MSVRSQINRVHAAPPNCRNISFIVILSSTVRSFKWSISFCIPPPNTCTCFLLRHTRPISTQYKAPSAFIPSSSYFPARFKYSVNISCNCHLCLRPSHRPQTPDVVELLIMQFSPAPLQPFIPPPPQYP